MSRRGSCVLKEATSGSQYWPPSVCAHMLALFFIDSFKEVVCWRDLWRTEGRGGMGRGGGGDRGLVAMVVREAGWLGG